jgi:putative tryptophan/tyrosine transport system substrate-binding protein
MWRHIVGLLVMLACGILCVPLPTNAQRLAHVPRIGYLGARPPELLDIFRQALHELGHVEGENIVLEYRNAEGREERLPDLAAELVRLPVDVIATQGLAATRAAKQVTTTIPIVQVAGGDLVLAGLVASLARPGGNITGMSTQDVELGGKRLELLKEAMPHASRIAVLWNAAHPAKALEWHNTQEAARALGVTLHSVEVRGPDDFARAFTTITEAHPDALLTLTDSLTMLYRQQIGDFATTQRLPMMAEIKEFAAAGALMTYGTNYAALRRHAATYVDKILKGAKPGDLPIEQPMTLELVINLKTAKALGVTLPATLLMLADEVIQ